MKTIQLVGDLSYAVKCDSIVDGEGLRVVLFFQGCHAHCRGCQNPKTWNEKHGKAFLIDEVVNYLLPLLKGKFCEGLTLSGGDPFLQDEGATELVQKLRLEIPTLNVWAYTGYLYEEIEKTSQLIKELNVLVDGPFILEKRYPLKRFRGSNNQRLIRLENGNVTRIE